MTNPDNASVVHKIRSLARMRSEQSIPVFLQGLNQEDNSVQAWAAWGLAQIGSDVVVTHLLAALGDSSPQVRKWATWALGEIGSEQAVTGLLDALNHEDAQVRWRAATALGRIANPVAIDPLLQVLREDEDHYVRGRAIWALGQLRSDAALEDLKRALYDPDFYIHTKAVYALGNLASEDAVSILLEGLYHPVLEVRAASVSVLGEIGTETAIAGILQSLSDGDVFVRTRVVEALGNIGTPTVIAGIRQALNDEDAYVRDRAAAVIEKLKGAMNRDVQDTPAMAASSIQIPGLPKLWIGSFSEASEYLWSKTPGSSIHYLISIGSPGVAPPPGYTRIPHHLRLEFDDIDMPHDDPEYVLPTAEHILQIIEFTNLISSNQGDLLIHCQSGVSRSAAVALIVCAELLGVGREDDALANVLAVRPQALPNLWIVQLADDILNCGGRLVQVVQQHHDAVK